MKKLIFSLYLIAFSTIYVNAQCTALTGYADKYAISTINPNGVYLRCVNTAGNCNNTL